MNKQYFCESCMLRTSSRGGDYLTLLLTDTVEKISVSCWDAPFNVKPTDLQTRVLVLREIQEKNGYKNVKWADISVAESDMIPEDSPLRKIKVETDVTVEQLVKAVNAFKVMFPQNWARFLDWLNPESYFNAFGNTPAGIQVHHNIRGGLKEHVYEMLSMYYKLSSSYVCKSLRHEFVVIGIMFHDYGKMYEYNAESREITESIPLLGQTFIS